MTWVLSHLNEDGFRTYRKIGEWSDSIVEQAVKKIKRNFETLRSATDRVDDLEVVKEFLPDPIKEALE